MGKRRSLKADRIHAPEARTPDGPGVAQTRALILRQATELFAERGYGRVTVADIASAAGVAAKTVFASVGSKGDILDRIVDQGVADSGYEQAMRQILALRTPEAVLKALAQGTRMGNEGQFTVHEAIRKALPVHESGEALWERATAAYRDLLWLWFGPTGWRTLVVENGWSWDQAESVLCRTAIATLR
ncbi:helix-turn-helix domain-containing protein [Streptomyces sp. NPDC021354]|uniref:TetR/AcrR family transcriptional regulator n=1 Tax=Streptomyces sp. NPDC021354 TaxID=3154793 RepID=UPI0033E34931